MAALSMSLLQTVSDLTFGRLLSPICRLACLLVTSTPDIACQKSPPFLFYVFKWPSLDWQQRPDMYHLSPPPHRPSSTEPHQPTAHGTGQAEHQPIRTEYNVPCGLLLACNSPPAPGCSCWRQSSIWGRDERCQSDHKALIIQLISKMCSDMHGAAQAWYLFQIRNNLLTVISSCKISKRKICDDIGKYNRDQ